MSKKTPTAPPVSEPSSETLLLLDPQDILADDNSRFDLKELQVESLANDILEKGEVTTPVEVEEIEGAKAAPHYRLTAGFYRHAAATRLNTTANAGVMLPARVKNIGDPATRLRRQLSENMERENQSPMDKAVAIKRLMDVGLPRQEIRRIFSAPGGRKGMKLQAASNSFINIMLNLLELPKTIQRDIHDGVIGVAAAYELGKVPPEKRQVVVDRAKADYDRQRQIEENDEKKLLEQEGKLEAAQAKAQTAAEQIAEAEAEAAKSIELVGTSQEKLRALQKFPLQDGRGFHEMTEIEKRQATEAIKAAEADFKAAEKVLKDATKKVDKLKGIKDSASKTAEQVRKKLEEARKPKKAKRGVSKEAVQKAAKEEGVGNGTVKLSAAEMREVVDNWAGGQVAVPRVTQLGVIVKECFDGITTPKAMIAKVYEFLGLTPPATR